MTQAAARARSPHLLLHRRPHLRLPGAAGGRRRAAARRRHDEREAAGLPRPLRLGPDRADVRAARARRDVGLDPLPADHAGRRRRRAVHRGLGLPADVRARHHRHRDHGAGARAGERRASRACSGSTRRRGGWWRAYEEAGRFVERVRITNVDVVPGADARCGSTARSWASWWSTSPMAATSTPSSSRSRTIPGLDEFSAGQILRLSPLLRRAAERGGRGRRTPRTRPSAASRTSSGPAGRAARARTPATPCSTATRRSTAARAAPAPRPGWRSSRPRGRLKRRRRVHPREHHRQRVRGPGRGARPSSPAGRRSSPRSPAGRG